MQHTERQQERKQNEEYRGLIKMQHHQSNHLLFSKIKEEKDMGKMKRNQSELLNASYLKSNFTTTQEDKKKQIQTKEEMIR
jgi:hypothetical protein